MRRFFGIAFLLLSVITVAVWAVSKFIQPLLPGDVNSNLVLFFALLSGVAAFFSTFKDTIELVRLDAGTENEHILSKKLSDEIFDRATIKNSTRYYIEPKCSDSITLEEQEKKKPWESKPKKVFSKIENFLDQSSKYRHLLILADSGMGKTSCLLNFYARNEKRFGSKKHRIVLIPLSVADADIMIASVLNPEETNLFLDAFDEDTKAIDDPHGRVLALMNACSRFRRVIITCRTQFFVSEDELPSETGIMRIGPRSVGEKREFEFQKLYLLPFDDNQITHYLLRRFLPWNLWGFRKAKEIIEKIPELSVRPMLLAHIPDVIASRREIRDAFQLYEIMIDGWLERESDWVSKRSLYNFSMELAVELYINRQKRGGEYINHNELRNLAKKGKLKIENWKVRARSLLNRDAQGNYKFSHRSILEYLVVQQLLIGNKNLYGVTLSDQMKIFLLEILSHRFLGFGSLRLIFTDSELLVFPLENCQPSFLQEHHILPLSFEEADMKLVEIRNERIKTILNFSILNRHQGSLRIDPQVGKIHYEYEFGEGTASSAATYPELLFNQDMQSLRFSMRLPNLHDEPPYSTYIGNLEQPLSKPYKRSTFLMYPLSQSAETPDEYKLLTHKFQIHTLLRLGVFNKYYPVKIYPYEAHPVKFALFLPTDNRAI